MIKFSVLAAESHFQQTLWVFTDYTRTVFNTFLLTLGVKCACLLASFLKNNWMDFNET